MRANRVMFLFWTVLGAAWGQPGAIIIRVYDYAEAPESVLRKATQEAQRLFRKAEIETRWLECPLSMMDQKQTRFLACDQPMSPADVVLRIVPPSMTPGPNARTYLGCARLPAGERLPARDAYVLYDQVLECVRKHPWVSMPRLFGYVMAHETAHLLFDNARHARQGLMMPWWPEKELMEMERGVLAFSGEEVRLLRGGATTRLQGSGH